VDVRADLAGVRFEFERRHLHIGQSRRVEPRREDGGRDEEQSGEEEDGDRGVVAEVFVTYWSTPSRWFRLAPFGSFDR
jgi:hypothetical protein